MQRHRGLALKATVNDPLRGQGHHFTRDKLVPAPLGLLCGPDEELVRG